MQSPPFPRYLVPPRSKYSPQHHVLKHPQLPFLPQCQRPSFRGCRHKLRIWNTYCSSMSNIFTQTLLNMTLYVHCLSCCLLTFPRITIGGKYFVSHFCCAWCMLTANLGQRVRPPTFYWSWNVLNRPCLQTVINPQNCISQAAPKSIERLNNKG